MARDPSKKQPSVITDPNLEEQIRCRAYELYEQRDQEDGHDVDDWLRAEAEIIGTNLRTAA